MQALITHRFPIEEAPRAYELITGKLQEPYLGVLLTYPQAESQRVQKVIFSTEKSANRSAGALTLGVIGAGNYANAVFLPAVKKAGGVRLVGISTSSGLSAQHTARKFGFAFASSSNQDILNDKGINTIAVLTRHQTHARFSLEALKNGKHVYCEKPLAIHKAELDEIAASLKQADHPYLSVGFNRRFAPMAQSLKSYFKDSVEPFFVNYRVNAGFIPADHWLHDPTQGGGRLVGEACHFIDFVCFMTGSQAEEVRAVSLPDAGKYSRDNFQITIQFEDGSVGIVSYLSNGNKRFPKEYVEVFNGGKIGILNDFRTLELWDEQRTISKKSLLRQDKGHQAAWKAFIDAIEANEAEPIAYEQLLLSSYTTLACNQSVLSGKPVKLAEFLAAD